MNNTNYNVPWDDYTKWVETYVIWPRKTVRGKWVYLQKIYTRKAWAPNYSNYGEYVDPVREYATLLDVMRYAPTLTDVYDNNKTN